MVATGRAVPVRPQSAPGPKGVGSADTADDALVGHLTPDADLIGFPEMYELLVGLPGLSAPDVDVALTEREVIVAAVKPDPEMTSCAALARHLAERRYGAVHRAFALPPGIDRAAVRATIEGLLASILQRLGLDRPVPDHSTVARRARTAALPSASRSSGGPTHLLVDSTGLKLCGPGEWLIERHGTKRRCPWRALHIGLDAGSGRLQHAGWRGEPNGALERRPR